MKLDITTYTELYPYHNISLCDEGTDKEDIFEVPNTTAKKWLTIMDKFQKMQKEIEVFYRDHKIYPKLPETWTIGKQTQPGSITISFGPFDTEKEALQMVGESDGYRIIHFRSDGRDKVAYIWQEDRWIKISTDVREQMVYGY